MAYPAGSGRVAIQGTVTDGEIFEVTFGLLNVLVANGTEANTLAQRIATHFTADLGGAAAAIMSTDMTYTGIKVYCYPESGTKATYIGQAPMSVPGTSPTLGPLQVSCVATLLTGLAGRRNRGRMYFPACGSAYAAGHLFIPAPVAALPPAIAQFFQDIAQDATASAQPSVISLASSSGQAITQVTVNQRADIQRRRADKQPNGTTTSANVAL